MDNPQFPVIRPLPPQTQPANSPAVPKFDGIDLLFSDDAPTAQKVDQPVLDGQDLLFGADTEQPIDDPSKPKQGWGEWLSEQWKGKQDPNYQGVGTVYDQFTDDLRSPTATAAMLNASDDQMTDIITKQLGDRYVRREKDANGYDIIVTRGNDGSEQRGYVNVPGIDTQDLWRTFYGIPAYAAVGSKIGAATKGMGALKQGAAQAAGAFATSAAGDIAQKPLGSEQGVELGKAALVSGLAGAAPLVSVPISAAWREFVTVPSLFDKATGSLTPKGVEAAKKAGLDTADLSPDFSKRFAESFARSADIDEAATSAGVDRFGIPATKGQITKDKELLHREEAMRWGTYGETAKKMKTDFDKKQKEAIDYAAFGKSADTLNDPGVPYPKQGIGEIINPGRQSGAYKAERSSGSLGANAQDALQAAREGARKIDADLWDDGVRTLTAKTEALEMMPSIINPKIAEIPIDATNTPVAWGMRDQLTKFIRGQAPEQADTPFTSAPVKTVDQMRRRLGSAVDSAQTGQDQAAARALYDGYNDWIMESAKRELLDGDPNGAMNLAKARGFHREIKSIFEPKGRDGRLTPGAQRLKKVLDDGRADSGEAVVNALFGSQGSRSVSDGAVTALKSFKQAVDRFAPEIAEQSWNDVRLAYWARLVTDKTGETVGPQAMLTNVKSALNSQASVVNTLYTPVEQRTMREFVRALEAVTYKPPNASGSSYGVANFVKQGMNQMLSYFLGGKGGIIANVALDKLGLPDAVGRKAAARILDRSGPPKRVNLAPAASVSGAVYDRSKP